MENNSNINIIDKKNRLEKAVAYLKGAQIIKNQKDISDTGIVSEESLTRALKGNEKYLTDNFLKKIAAKYGFNSDWFLTGNGSMLIPQIEEVMPEDEDDLVLFLRDERKGYDITLTDIYEKTRIPVKTLKEAQNGISELSKKQRNILSKYIEEVREYFQNESIGAPKGTPTGYYYPEIYAKAGFDIANFNNEMQRLPVYIPNFSKDVIFINVYGDSMYPKYKAGDVIGIKPVDFLYLVFGHPYVVVFDNGDVNIKYVRRGSDDDHVILESENPKYDPREYPLRIIRAFYTVEGSVKKERM